ncbi:MAG TPA: two-component regulator propeller domain-containing protein, partial [Chitinophagaceae bacterium]|nr:two-component regulator propeller domain-containing protein [Chitinophagaceae bacterium]
MIRIVAGLLFNILMSSTRGGELPPMLRLGIEKGLSNNSVRCIFQDKRGFVWIGTYDGLNRYNGSEFRIFRNRVGDSSSLPHNYIYAIHEDEQGVWVGTGQGPALLDPLSGKFSRLYFYAPGSKQIRIADFSVNNFYTDEPGNTFIATNGQGLLLRNRGDRFAKQIPLVTVTGIYSDFNARAVCSSGNDIYVFVTNYGMCKYDPVKKIIVPVNGSLNTANCLLPDGDGNIWVGSDLGVDQFNTSTGRYIRSFREKPGQLSNMLVTALFLGKDKELWVGTDGGGINIIRPDQRFEYLLPGNKKNSLSSESVCSIISDKESRIWIGTLKGGCNVIDPFKNHFLTVSADPASPNGLPSNFVHSFCEDRITGEIFVGTDGAGLSVWNRATNSFRNLKYQSNDPSSLSHNAVTSIVQDHTGEIWLATYGGGINKLNRASRKFKRYSCINDSTGAEDKFTFLLYEDHARNLWATTFAEGKLYRYNRQKDKFEVFSQQLFNLVALAEDRKGQLWAGNSTNLVRIDRNNNNHLFYHIGKPVRAIYEGKDNEIWVGSEGGGLMLFDANTGKITERYSDINGLCSNSVLNIKEDEFGHLWLSTFNGISRFDPVKKTFENFFQSDGLQSNQFTYNAATKLSSGELIFGGINGFNVFRPNDISVRDFMPTVLITDILVNNKRLADEESFVGKKKDGQVQELHIPYSEALLAFKFDALEFSSPEKISYAYLLEGWDRDWNFSGNIRNINYNNLREGAYLLRIKSTNASGAWNKSETHLKIVIFPPWYRSWWAFMIYMVIFSGFVYAFHNYRDQKNKLKYEIKYAQVQAANERDVNEKRLSFFTNISHEIRTPLTLIINPLKDLVEKQESQDQAELNSVYKNAKRLLSLVDQLLIFRKTESDTGQLSVSKLNLFQVCREVCGFFLQVAKAKKIEFTIDEPGEGNFEIYGDKEKLELVIYNLISNALKYTPDGGKVHLYFEGSDQDLSLYVSDSGPGIPAEVGQKLFDKFYQVQEAGKKGKPGFGIGMYLAKQLVDLHKGSLSYETALGQGTIFKVTLLKGAEHFGNIGDHLIHELPENSIVQEIAEGQQAVLPLASNESDGLESIVSDKHTILIVDDNPQMRSYLAQLFLKEFNVYEAADGEEGCRIAREIIPDIIVSDVVMNEKTGLDFCQEVKGTPELSHIPFILITGSYSPETKKMGFELGADDYITKPFEKELLVARVKNLIRNQQNLQKYFYNEITHQKNNLKISAEYKEFLDACIEIVERRLDDDNFNVLELASEIGM